MLLYSNWIVTMDIYVTIYWLIFAQNRRTVRRLPEWDPRFNSTLYTCAKCQHIADRFLEQRPDCFASHWNIHLFLNPRNVCTVGEDIEHRMQKYLAEFMGWKSIGGEYRIWKYGRRPYRFGFSVMNQMFLKYVEWIKHSFMIIDDYHSAKSLFQNLYS